MIIPSRMYVKKNVYRASRIYSALLHVLDFEVRMRASQDCRQNVYCVLKSSGKGVSGVYLLGVW